MWETVTSFFAGQIFPYILSAVLMIVTGIFGSMFGKVNKTIKEAGEFMTALGYALEDKKLTKSELRTILKEGKDVFNIWTKTPDKYKSIS
jgi:hypothetical protein